MNTTRTMNSCPPPSSSSSSTSLDPYLAFLVRGDEEQEELDIVTTGNMDCCDPLQVLISTSELQENGLEEVNFDTLFETTEPCQQDTNDKNHIVPFRTTSSFSSFAAPPPPTFAPLQFKEYDNGEGFDGMEDLLLFATDLPAATAAPGGVCSSHDYLRRGDGLTVMNMDEEPNNGGMVPFLEPGRGGLLDFTSSLSHHQILQSQPSSSQEPSSMVQAVKLSSKQQLLQVGQGRKQDEAKVGTVTTGTTTNHASAHATAGTRGAPTGLVGSSASASASASSSLNLQSMKWDERYQELVQYKKRYGHTNVPNRWKTNFPLAQWVKRQRYQHRLKMEGKNSTLTDKRQIRLVQLGFIWDLQEAIWEERLEELYKFRSIYGHCKVPSKYDRNPDLAIWAKTQRRHFKMYCTHHISGRPWNSSIMNHDRIVKLAQAGFVFSHHSSKGALEMLKEIELERRKEKKRDVIIDKKKIDGTNGTVVVAAFQAVG